MNKIIRSRFALPLALTAAATLAACGGGGGGGAGSGTLRLGMTDAPACGYDQVNVTVDRVRVNQSSTAGDGDAGWTEVVLSPAKRIDLLSLTNGVLEELGQTALPAGKYTQMRLVLVANSGSTPLANSVKPTGAAEVALNTPSASQSGLKMNVNIDVAANQTADFLLDFDACKSVVVAGASGNYNLKPVISVIARLSSGVVGFVDPALANGNTAVSVQQNGTVIKATVPDSTGRFVLSPVGAGTYTLVLTAPARTTTVVTAVPVTANTMTTLNTTGTPIVPPVALTGTAAGVVSMSSTPIDATVRATQTLSGSTTIEIVNNPVNAVTGAYSYTLPAVAPRSAPYAAALGTLTFTTDGTAGTSYTLRASSGTLNATPATISIAPSTTVTTNFGL